MAPGAPEFEMETFDSVLTDRPEYVMRSWMLGSRAHSGLKRTMVRLSILVCYVALQRDAAQTSHTTHTTHIMAQTEPTAQQDI